MIKILIHIFLLMLFLKELKEELTYLQQASYHICRYKKHFKSYFLNQINSFIRMLIVFFCILYTLTNYVFIGISIFTLCLFSFFFKNEFIKPLKYTKRVIRLIVFCIVFFLSISLVTNTVITSLVIWFLPLFVIISTFIMKPLEYIVQKRYVKKAKQKLKTTTSKKIGITGSFGKTSTKYYLDKILSQKNIVRKTPKSYNTLMGITKDILTSMPTYLDYYVLEMGASNKHDILKINKLVECDYALITGIGTNHLTTFKTFDNLVKTKMEIILSPNIKCLFINSDDNVLMNYQYPNDLKVVKVGTTKDANYLISEINSNLSGLEFLFNGELIKTKLLGEHNVINVALAMAVGLEAGLTMDEIKHAVQDLKNVNHRLELKEFGSYQILDDSYNSNYQGFLTAIKLVSKSDKTKIIITPGFVEQDMMLEEYYQTIGPLLNQVFDEILLVENKSTDVLIKYLKPNTYKLFSSYQDAKTDLDKRCLSNFILLIENDLTDYYLH